MAAVAIVEMLREICDEPAQEELYDQFANAIDDYLRDHSAAEARRALCAVDNTYAPFWLGYFAALCNNRNNSN